MKKIGKISGIAGLLSLAAGIVCFIVKMCSEEYVDAAGILHEHFFLLPLGWALLLAGIVLLGAHFIARAAAKRNRNEE